MMEAIDLSKLAIVLALLAAPVAVALYDWLYGWPLVKRVRALELECEALREAGAAGATLVARLAPAEARLQEQLGQLEERLAQLELVNQSAPYERAIGLAEQGEEAERLIPYLGLSQGEAELVRLLHGGRASA